MTTDPKGRTPFSFRARGRSFVYAFAGLRSLVREEHNARIHCVAALLAVALGFALRISAAEWCVVILCIGGVIAAEGVNSAVEAICDEVSPGFSPLIKKAKDIAAASVLVLALASLICGMIIFIPRLISVFNGAL